MKHTPKRCQWATPGDLLYESYHDHEWGVPIHDDKILFEFLILEGAQAGLSWITVLKRREAYREAFAGFDPKKVASFTQDRIEKILEEGKVIKNRLKVESTVTNAKNFIAIQKEFGSFDKYVWQFVQGKPIINGWKSMTEIPVETKESISLSKDLKKRGFKFVGPTIMYAYMQAVGLVNDHLIDCFCYK